MSAGRNEGPIEDLSGPAVGGGVRVEQQRIARLRGCAANASKSSSGVDPRGLQVRHAKPAHSSGVSSPWNCSSDSGTRVEHGVDLVARRIDEQADGRDRRRHARDQTRGLLDRHDARARRIEHEAECVDAEFDGRIDVLLARQSAELDSRAVVAGRRLMRVILARSRHGSIENGTGAGSTMDDAVLDAREIQAVGHEGRRRRAAVAAGEQPVDPLAPSRPRPIATSEPTRLRTMCCTNAFARNVKRTKSPLRCDRRPSTSS